MNPTLQQLKDLGVRELSVTNNSAIAVNPYGINPSPSPYSQKAQIWYNRFIQFNELNLPPLPTSGIKDGIVSIEQVKPVWQYLYDGKEWEDLDDEEHANWHRDKYKLPIRQALVLKQVNKYAGMSDNIEEVSPTIIPDYKVRGQVKEEEPKAEVKKTGSIVLGYFEYDHVNGTEKWTPASSVEPEGEQTAEGSEPKAWVAWRDHKDNANLDGYSFVQGYVTAASQLAQYKAKLIEQLRATQLGYVKVCRLAESTGVEQAIDLIQNS